MCFSESIQVLIPLGACELMGGEDSLLRPGRRYPDFPFIVNLRDHALAGFEIPSGAIRWTWLRSGRSFRAPFRRTWFLSFA